jgi:hypothetical protein
LAEPLGTFVRFALVEAGRKGKSLTLVSGLRTNDQQVSLRKAHCGSSQYAIYDAPSSSCSPPTARPGSSKHETGEAADMGGAKDWMASLLSPFNVKRPVRGEDWHFEWKGADAKADLERLADVMDGLGYTSAEADRVFPSGVPAAGGDGVISIATRWGVRLLDLATFGQFSNTVSGLDATASAVSDIAGALRAVNALADRLTDPGFWMRVGVGVLGAAMFYYGALLVGRSVISVGGVSDAVGKLAR